MKSTLQIFFAVLILVAAGLFLLVYPSVSRAEETVIVKLKNGQQYVFTVEIANTPEEREKGLMYRRAMAPDHGMLFDLPRVEPVSFWMKDTFIPLDIIFIDQSGHIAKIHANATPQSLEPISSDTPVRAVLEINGGRAAELGISFGDAVSHRYFNPAQDH